MTQGTLIEIPQHNGNPDPNQRYTTREALAWCKRVAGVDSFDLDAAACHESHHARDWYGDKGSHFLDGLSNVWYGNVWCNPPWDDIEPWTEKAWRSFAQATPSVLTVSMLLPGDRTHRPWWQRWVEPYRDQPLESSHDLAFPDAVPEIVLLEDRPRLTLHFAPEGFVPLAYTGKGDVLEEMPAELRRREFPAVRR